MIDLSIYNQQAPEIEELYISSELYPILIRDAFTASGDVNGLNYLNVVPVVTDNLGMSGAMQGNHDLITIRQDYELFEPDEMTMAGSLIGNHSLISVRQDYELFEPDVMTMTGSVQGNHSLIVVRIDYEVYDTDTFEMSGSMQGNHSLT